MRDTGRRQGNGASLLMTAAYATRNQSDIVFEASGPTIASGFFANVGATQRLGAEWTANARWRDFDFRANYGFVNATFELPFTDPSENNPSADADGNICVKPGDRMASVPRSSAKLDLGYAATPFLHLGVNATLEPSQYLRGDEANLQRPLPGYAIFGQYGDPTGNGAFPQFTNPHFIVPAQPLAFWAGIHTVI